MLRLTRELHRLWMFQKGCPEMCRKSMPEELALESMQSQSC